MQLNKVRLAQGTREEDEESNCRLRSSAIVAPVQAASKKDKRKKETVAAVS